MLKTENEIQSAVLIQEVKCVCYYLYYFQQIAWMVVVRDNILQKQQKNIQTDPCWILPLMYLRDFPTKKD